MLTQEQKNSILFAPSFQVNLKTASGTVSVLGQAGKGFVEVALMKGDGHIDHEPPFPHDGFGIATFFREEIDKIEALLNQLERIDQ